MVTMMPLQGFFCGSFSCVCLHTLRKQQIHRENAGVLYLVSMQLPTMTPLACARKSSHINDRSRTTLPAKTICGWSNVYLKFVESQYCWTNISSPISFSPASSRNYKLPFVASQVCGSCFMLNPFRVVSQESTGTHVASSCAGKFVCVLTFLPEIYGLIGHYTRCI